MNEHVNECVDRCVNGCVDECLNKCVDECVNRCVDGCVNKFGVGCVDGCALLDPAKCVQVVGRHQVDREVHVWMCGWMCE